jgi:hypothetical protein
MMQLFSIFENHRRELLPLRSILLLVRSDVLVPWPKRYDAYGTPMTEDAHRANQNVFEWT